MPLALSSSDIMEFLWDTLEKTPDGKHLHYNIYDVEMLWRMGFVDTERVSMEEWKQVFEPYRQQDGTFLLNKEAFFALDKYRYKGEIHIPFDAMRINEGLYTDVGLDELIEASIKPSCSLSREELKKFFDALKEEYRTPDGLIKIGPEAKMKIRDMINSNPSPLRNLEILFDQTLAKGGDKEIIEQVEAHKADIATIRAAIESSTFLAGPKNKTEAAATALKRLTKTKNKKVEIDTTTPTVSLRKIKRSRKGVRG